jgi:hypothetical protein
MIINCTNYAENSWPPDQRASGRTTHNLFLHALIFFYQGLQGNMQLIMQLSDHTQV